MAKTIKVTPSQLESAASAISSLAGDYQTLYKKLYTEVGAMENTWKGDDNIAYTKQIGEFENDFTEMHGLMMDYVDFLQKSANAYRTTQENVVREAGKLAIDA